MNALALATRALASKKLRLAWRGAPPPGVSDELLLPRLWARLRAAWPEPPGASQDERVTLEVLRQDATTLTLAWEATYDFDFCSQYDRTETKRGELEVTLP